MTIVAKLYGGVKSEKKVAEEDENGRQLDASPRGKEAASEAPLWLKRQFSISHWLNAELVSHSEPPTSPCTLSDFLLARD